MSAELVRLYHDLNLEKLRVTPPSRLVFLCGGVINGSNVRRASSLRDYLYRVKNIQNRLRGQIVLAERANQLYRETSYKDLISFEEDIARISAVVLVIAESPGALAELGAFSANQTIARALRVVMQEKYASAESFIRFGPVQRIMDGDREHVGFYPWRTDGKGQVVTSSASPHVPEIVKFINQHLDKLPSKMLFRKTDDARQFYVFYWVIFLAKAISHQVLFGHLQGLYPTLDVREFRNRLFCMELAGWIGKVAYSGKDYYYVKDDADPFHYAFREGVVEKDSIRRKLTVAESLRAAEHLPKQVIRTVAEKRAKSK